MDEDRNEGKKAQGCGFEDSRDQVKDDHGGVSAWPVGLRTMMEILTELQTFHDTRTKLRYTQFIKRSLCFCPVCAPDRNRVSDGHDAPMPPSLNM